MVLTKGSPTNIYSARLPTSIIGLSYHMLHSVAVFTLEDEQIVWTDKFSGICPSDVNLCCTVVDLFVSTGKSCWINRLSRRPNVRRFVRRKICSSRLHIPRFVRLRRFVRSDDLFVLWSENGH